MTEMLNIRFRGLGFRVFGLDGCSLFLIGLHENIACEPEFGISTWHSSNFGEQRLFKCNTDE